MSKFDEMLSNSLDGLNQGYEQAKQGLENVVGEVTESLNKAVGSAFEFKLSAH